MLKVRQIGSFYEIRGICKPEVLKDENLCSMIEKKIASSGFSGYFARENSYHVTGDGSFRLESTSLYTIWDFEKFLIHNDLINIDLNSDNPWNVSSNHLINYQYPKLYDWWMNENIL